MVLDADGLNAHAGALETLAARAGATVLTPHAGELGRLLELPSAEIERERLRHARDAAVRARAVVLLKGDDTLIAAPGGPVLVSPGGSPALATAGTGDVLAGVIAALLAAGLDALTAAAAGVWMHGAAGREAARREGSAEGVIAGDVISALPAVRSLGGDSVSVTRASAEVELGAIERNCARLRSELHGGAALCAVVKADGYGHGALASARAALTGGASWLAVASAEEAAELRRAGVTGTRILVMGALTDEELRVALAADADLVVWRERDVEAVADAGGGRVHVKLDTGMGRLGTRDPAEAERVLRRGARRLTGWSSWGS